MASLGNDLATIREQLGKTLEDIHDTTKIPLNILEAIEDGSIFTEFDENKTYIRSYIRGYGKALNIDDSDIVEALDYYEIGTYDGQLLKMVGLEDAKGPRFTYDEDTEEKSTPLKEEGEEPADNNKPSSFSDQSSSDIHDHGPQQKSSPPPVSSVDWADLGRQFTPLETNSSVWIGATIVLIIIVGVVGYWLYQNSSFYGFQEGEEPANTTQNVTRPGIVPDSLQLNLTETEDTTTQTAQEAASASRQTLQSLPDTLNLVIYAAYDRLNPVRVYSDVMGDFNPYWIEQGQAYRFEFVNLIRIRGQYSRMELLLNGHPIENFAQRFRTAVTPDSQYVEITRSFFEGDDSWLQPPPDSTALNFPPPSSVVNRPRFPTSPSN